MSTLTLEPLAETVGARVLGVDLGRLANDDKLPQQVLDALEANGGLVFPELGMDDPAHVAFSRRLGRPETFRLNKDHPEIFRVTLDPARSRVANYLLGTFVWHIDGLTEDIPIMATLLAAKEVAAEGGETEFASTYQAYE